MKSFRGELLLEVSPEILTASSSNDEGGALLQNTLTERPYRTSRGPVRRQISTITADSKRRADRLLGPVAC